MKIKCKWLFYVYAKCFGLFDMNIGDIGNIRFFISKFNFFLNYSFHEENLIQQNYFFLYFIFCLNALHLHVLKC